MDFLNEKKKGYIYIILILLLLIIISLNGFIIYKIDKLNKVNEDVQVEELVPIIEEPSKEEITEPIQFFVDIKGAINNPGVYLVNEGSIVNEVINMAGGLKTNAYIKNINLSKTVTKEMVIVIYTNNEIAKMNEPEPTCICNDVNINNCLDNNASIITPGSEQLPVDNPKKKININKASLEELMSLDGIGEAKAKSIIEYRNTNGLFKSLEELKNISGISEKIYEKIKNNIEL